MDLHIGFNLSAERPMEVLIDDIVLAKIVQFQQELFDVNVFGVDPTV